MINTYFNSEKYEEAILEEHFEGRRTLWPIIAEFMKLHKATHAKHRVDYLERFRKAIVKAGEYSKGTKFALKVFRRYIEKDSGDDEMLIASFRGYTELAKAFCKDDLGRVNIRSEITQITPLIYAADNGHFELVQWLLAQGALITDKCTQGRPSLYFACKNGHSKIVKEILDAGADLHEEVPGKSPIELALHAKAYRLAFHLFARGAKPPKLTENDKTNLKKAFTIYESKKPDRNLLQIIFQHIEDEDLFELRLINKQWNAVILDYLYKIFIN